MKFIQNLIRKENFWQLLFIFVASLLAARTLIFQSGYFNMHDDLQMMRQLEMEKCFLDGQVPCRWVPDMGYGYGFPLFNFYPPLPYLVGQLFRVVGFSFVVTVKLTFALSLFASGLAMYFLAKEFFGKAGASISSIFYIWAPYHSVDIYVRGAMNESWALVWFPLILWTSYKLLVEKKRLLLWLVSLSLSWVGLLLSHNLMVMIFTPLFALWCLFFWFKQKSIGKVLQLAVSGLMSAMLAAFFTLPAIFEQKFIHVDTLTQGYYEYIAHYVSIGQLLISRFWGYGPSVWGTTDGMPYQLGYSHWILSLIILILLAIYVIKGRKRDIFSVVTFFGISLGWFAAFMTHQNSIFIWQKIHPMAFVQFPWRFLTLSILGFSLASGAIIKLVSKKYKFIVFVTLIFVLFGLNWNYFLPQDGKMGSLTDEQKFNGAAWNLQRTAGIFDYLPNTAQKNPKDPPSTLAEVVKGDAKFSNQVQGTNWASFSVNAASDSLIKINIFMFPGWQIKIDEKNVEAFVPDFEKYGTMYINVPSGSHAVSLKLHDTDIRRISNQISLLGWLVVLPLVIIFRKKINEKLV